MRKIEQIIIHCTATKPHQDIGVEEINLWHKAQGWKSVGYHYVVRLDGRVEKGRSEEEIGAHCRGQNRNSIGICYVGGLDVSGRPRDTRTEAQKKSLQKLVASLRLHWGALPVVGHRTYTRKACPSFDVSKEYAL